MSKFVVQRSGQERSPEQKISRSLAARVFNGSQKVLSNAAERNGSGRIADFRNNTWLTVSNRSGGRVFLVRGLDQKCVDEAVKLLQQGEIDKILHRLATAAKN